jgi:hypothetical protein
VVLRVQPIDLSSYTDEMGDDLFSLPELFYEGEKNALRYPYWKKEDASTMFTRWDRLHWRPRVA